MTKDIFVSFILDETGSMEIAWQETIDGFNSYIKELKDGEGKNVRFSLTQFNADKVEVVHDAVKLKKVKELTKESYRPYNMTPLYDAIAVTIKRTADKAGKNPVLFVIMTDGEENSSREYGLVDIQKMIEKRTKKGWTFTYLGANQDSWAVGSRMGLAAGNVINFAQANTKQAMAGAAMAASSYAASGGAQSRSLWADAGVDEDELTKEQT